MDWKTLSGWKGPGCHLIAPSKKGIGWLTSTNPSGPHWQFLPRSVPGRCQRISSPCWRGVRWCGFGRIAVRIWQWIWWRFCCLSRRCDHRPIRTKTSVCRRFWRCTWCWPKVCLSTKQKLPCRRLFSANYHTSSVEGCNSNTDDLSYDCDTLDKEWCVLPPSLLATHGLLRRLRPSRAPLSACFF